MKLYMYRVSALLLAAILAIPALSSSTVFASTDLFVAVGGKGASCTSSKPCGSIQHAVNMASAWDRIFVGPGTYTENVTIPAGKDGLLLSGTSTATTVLVSAGGNPGQQAPAGVPADIALDIFARNVTIQQLTIRHPHGIPTKRDIGVFVRPPATNAKIQSLTIERQRTGNNLEPTMPGSRGVLVFRATGTIIQSSLLQGNYEDHIHLPTSQSTVQSVSVHNATRIGIVVIQENATSLSVNNTIQGNMVTGSGGDGIQIQGDRNIVQGNSVYHNGGYGIHLCGTSASSLCVPPGSSATASANVVRGNGLGRNALGEFADFGTNNRVNQ